MKDFFISYNRADRQWAEWIAWQLEANGYSTVIQAWDFRPGGNFALDMQQAATEAECTIAVQYDEAKQSFEWTLRIDEAAFGSNHPDVATYVNNLGDVLKKLGKLDEARQCFERALRIFTAFLGDDHPKTVGVRKNLKSLG